MCGLRFRSRLCWAFMALALVLAPNASHLIHTTFASAQSCSRLPLRQAMSSGWRDPRMERAVASRATQAAARSLIGGLQANGFPDGPETSQPQVLASDPATGVEVRVEVGGREAWGRGMGCGSLQVGLCKRTIMTMNQGRAFWTGMRPQRWRRSTSTSLPM